MRTNAAGIELIKRNEGCRLTAYLDPVNIWTIGYGDTGAHVFRGCTITQDEAERLLAERLLREFEPGVQRAIGDAPTNENQFAAMVSLAYNVGVGAFAKSSVARHHRAGEYAKAASSFHLWNKAGGKVLAGLVRRRAEEADLYQAEEDG
jgi:lysozyme